MHIKRFLILGICLLAVAQLKAQQKPFRIGASFSPKLGWMNPKSVDYEYDGLSMGFGWALVSEFQFTENYSLNTGLNVDYFNARLEYPHIMEVGGDEKSGLLHRKYHLRNVAVPLNLKLKTNPRGPYSWYARLGVLLSFNVKAEASDEFQYRLNSGEIMWTDENRHDIDDELALIHGAFQFGAGMEYTIKQSVSVFAELLFTNGFTNVLDGQNTYNPLIGAEAIPHNFSLTFGMMF